jgi:tRNA nucleotidyltransferase/poly(A) polymerase
VSRERITAELNLILKSHKPSLAFSLLDELGLLELLFPELQKIQWKLLDQTEQNPLLAWGLLTESLSPSSRDSFLKRLMFSREEKEILQKLPIVLPKFCDYERLSTAEKKDLLAESASPFVLKIFRINGKAYELAKKDLQNWKEILLEPPLLQGKDLMTLGVSPGKELGILLQEIRIQQRNEILKTKEEAVKYVKQKLKNASTS